MRFSIFYEHQLPRPWDEHAEHRLLKEALEQVQLADRLGFHCVWVVEHHFLEEYAHSSASDVFLAACAARTENIRLGFGILPLPPAYQHPARVAETAATLDLISDGRVELGTGETSSGAELAGFGVDRAAKRAQWEEALAVVARMMVEEPFAGVEGRYVAMPPRNVVPKPLQKPHPPLWVACSRRETIRLAAEKGLGALSFSFVDPEEAKQWVDEYYNILASSRCVAGGFSVNPNIGVTLPMMVHADESQAIERGIDGAHFFGYALAHYYAFGEHRPGRTSIWDEFQRRRDDVGFARSVITADAAPLGVKILQQGLGSLRGAIGTPEQVRDLVRRYEAAGVDELIFVMQAGRTEHQHICEALELFAAEVMPEFTARRPTREAAKLQRLGDAPAQALARREPARASDPAYAFAAMESGAERSLPRDEVTVDRRRARGAALRRTLEARGEQAFRSFAARAGDRVLERTVGSGPGLRALFGAMVGRFDPQRAGGFRGDIRYELRRGDGSARSFTVTIGATEATVRRGSAPAPAVIVRASVADFARMAARELDPFKAVLEGRLDFEGDFAIASRLGEMFGEPSPY